ncbi:hypothetical protein PVAND_001754 [Polypedilum vanderplanki]|uniref:Uncharacterized protein n=1 Tax=Polypedilum vanderplanki TaxID=319348 RepID=A0A9J6BNW1_POLVA|nr:hypothetical protein PVAND_001754 [Polypedilum vanderplanki]
MKIYLFIFVPLGILLLTLLVINLCSCWKNKRRNINGNDRPHNYGEDNQYSITVNRLSSVNSVYNHSIRSGRTLFFYETSRIINNALSSNDPPNYEDLTPPPSYNESVLKDLHEHFLSIE